MPDRLAQLQRGIEQRRNVEHHFVLVHGELGDARRRDQRGRHVNLIALLRRGPGADPCIAEGAIERAPAQLRGPRARRIAAPLTLRDAMDMSGAVPAQVIRSARTAPCRSGSTRTVRYGC